MESAPDPRDACVQVLEEAAPESLHWSVVLDRALKARLIDPFTTRDVRGTVVKTLAVLAKEGRITRDSKGTYRAGPPGPTGGDAGPGPEGASGEGASGEDA